MTKAELIDQVFLAIHGGQPSPDVNVQRVDIENLLPAKVSEAVLIWSRQSRRESLEEIRFFGGADGGSQTIDQQFLTTKKVSLTEDEERNLYYFDLPGRLQSVPLNRALDDVFPVQQSIPYVRVSSYREVSGLQNLPTVFFWHEDIGGIDRVFLYNISIPVCDHYVRYVASIADVADDEELPLPEGLQGMVIDLLMNFFMARGSEDELMNDDEDSKVFGNR